MKPHDIEDHIKKVELIYKGILIRHQHELNITEDLNRKATNIVIFSGILIGLMSNIIASNIANSSNILINFQFLSYHVQLHFLKLLFISLIFFICSVILGLFVILLDKWTYVNNDLTCPNYIINQYLITDLNFNDTMVKLSKEIACLTVNTIEVNKKKYKILKGSMLMFSAGILLLFATIELIVRFG
jgi:hypothetical protein